MKKNLFEEKNILKLKKLALIMALLSQGLHTSITASEIEMQTNYSVDNSFEKFLNFHEINLNQEYLKSFLESRIQLLSHSSDKFLNNLNGYIEELTAPTRSFMGEFLENKNVISLDEETVLPFILNHYNMTESDFNSFAAYVISSSQEYPVFWNNSFEIASMLYMSASIPNEEKLQRVLSTYGISYEEFMAYAGVVSAESRKTLLNGKDEPCYIDSYVVATNINGRANSKKWSGATVYTQVSRGGQYEVYTKALYKKYLNENNLGYQAALDVMYHNILCKENSLPLLQTTVWLEFARNGHPKGGTQVVPRGNMFRIPQSASDRIDQYVPSVNPSLIKFKKLKDGVIRIYIPEDILSTPSNASKNDVAYHSEKDILKLLLKF